MKVTDLTKCRKYKPLQVEAVLQALAYTGSPTRVAEAFSDTLGVDESLVRYWRDKLYRERYEQIRDEIGPQLEQHAIETSRQFIVAAGEKERELLEHLDPSKLDQRDISGTLRNVATAKALSNDKILGPLTGRPTAVVAHRTLDEYLGDLARRFPSAVHVVDSTAEELPEPTSSP